MLNSNKNRISNSSKDLYIEELSQSYQASIQYDTSSSLYKGIAIFISLITVFLSVFISNSNFIINAFILPYKTYLENYSFYIAIILSFFIFLVFIIWIRYISLEEKKSVAFKRKIILLRNILGIDYSSYKILRKNDYLISRNPIDVLYKENFLSTSMLSIMCVDLCLHIFIFFIFTKINNNYFLIFNNIALLFIINVSFLLLTRFLCLEEQHETVSLAIVKFLAKILRIRLQPNFEKIIYFNDCAVSEAQRLKIKLDSFYAMLIAIEDKNFKINKGIETWRILSIIINKLFVFFVPSTIRCCLEVVLSKYKYGKNFLKVLEIKGGASTITQQWIRSNFIIDYHKTYRRKIIEILLARFWAYKCFDKKQILNFYLVSARFDHNVFGVVDAKKYFFGINKKTLSNNEIFILLDRLSNINSEILPENIFNKIERVLNLSLLSQKDIEKIIKLYAMLISKNKIKDNKNGFVELQNFIENKLNIYFPNPHQ